MAEDWDLYAVVRGAGYKSNAETPATTPNIRSSIQDTNLSFLVTSTFDEENNPFSFPNMVQSSTSITGFQELNQLFTPFNPTTITTINSNSSFSGTTIRPHFMPEAALISSFDTFHDQQQVPVIVEQPLQQQQRQQEEFQVPQTSSSVILPNTLAQTPRSRKRKSQQKRMVCHVTAENLSADLWAWRKYGQKPIKGSPYPRNYYKCSSSKGCEARKQVERSTTEPDMFIVTYTGDHTHPRPTHRNSLAGSTRNKSSTNHGSGSPVNPICSSSKGSPVSPSSLSPGTSLTAAPQKEAAAVENPVSNNETQNPDPGLDVDLGADDDILIPDIGAMAEDIFGMGQFGDDTGDGGSS